MIALPNNMELYNAAVIIVSSHSYVVVSAIIFELCFDSHILFRIGDFFVG